MKRYLALLLLLIAIPIFGQRLVIGGSGAILISVNESNDFQVIVTGNITSTTLVTTSSTSNNKVITVFYTQNAVGGFTVAFGGNITTSCTVTTTANATTICRWQYDTSSNTWKDAGGSSGATPAGITGDLQCRNGAALAACGENDDGTNFNINRDAFFQTGVPYYDVHSYGASGSNQSTTGSITSGLSTLTLAAAQDFKNGQDVNVFGAGPTSAMLAPTGCTVVPVGVPGATTYNYQVSARDSLGGLSAATSVISTTTGNASLGSQLLTIAASGFVRTAGAVTITMTTSPSIPSGTVVDVYGTGDLSSNGRFTTSGGTANTITYTQANGSSRQADVTLSGGTVRVFNYNQLVCTGQSTNATGYIVYGRTGGSLTKVGSMTVETVTGQNPTFRDFGHTSSTPTDALSTNPPGAQTAQDLVATINSGGGTTTLTLSTTAGNTVSGNRVQHSDTRAINAAMTAAATSTRTAFGGGGIVNFSMGDYNFESLTFPVTTPNGAKWMVLQVTGELLPLQPIVLDTGQGPYKIVGMGGAGNTAFGKLPSASINNTGVNPAILVKGTSGNPTVIQNMLIATGAGDAIHYYGIGALAPSNMNLLDVQAQITSVANYGSTVVAKGSGFGLYINGGVYNASDDAPAIYTDKGFTTIMGDYTGKMQVASIECVNCGGDMIVQNVLQESGTRPFLNINSSVLKTIDITLDHISIADTAVPGAVPMVNNLNGGQGVYNLKITGYNTNGSDAIIAGVPVNSAFLQPGVGTSSGSGLAPIGQFVNTMVQDISGGLLIAAVGAAQPPLIIRQSSAINQDALAVQNAAGTRIAAIGKFGEGIFQADNTNSTFGIQVTGGGGQITKTDKFSNLFVRSENCPASFPLGITQLCGSGSANALNLGSASGYTGNYLSVYAVNSNATKVLNIDTSGNVVSSGYQANAGSPTGTSGSSVLGYDSTTTTSAYNTNNNGQSSFTGAWNCTNVTPVTVNTNTAADQNMMACTIPAGVLNRVGRSLRISIAGVYTTPAASVSQMTLKVKLCTVSGCGSGTVITPINIQSAALGTIATTNDPFNALTYSTTQTAGASSAHEAHGNFNIDLNSATTGALTNFADQNTTTVGTIDSTAQLFLQVTFAFSTASGSNSATQRQLVVETIN